MRLYSTQGSEVTSIRETGFALERELQRLVEGNLDLLFGLQYVRSEFTIAELRMDTVAFDAETNAFVIIEFKRSTDYSVVDQGFSYLAAMLNNQADFILEYQERTGTALKKTDVDWSQSRVAFVAPAFTRYQVAAVDFKDLPIELWEVRRFDGDIVAVRRIEKAGAVASFKAIQIDGDVRPIVEEVDVYDLSTLLRDQWGTTRELAEELIDALQRDWPSAEVVYRKKHFYLALPDKTRLVEVVPQKKGLLAHVGPPPAELPRTSLQFDDCSGVGRWVAGRSRVVLTTSDDIAELQVLIRRLYRGGAAPHPEPGSQEKPASPRTPRISIADLIAAGVAKPGDLWSLSTAGKTVEGEVTSDGGLLVDGVSYLSPSVAGQRVTGWKSCDGWKLWKYTGTDGTTKPIDELRRKLGGGREPRSRTKSRPTKEAVADVGVDEHLEGKPQCRALFDALMESVGEHVEHFTVGANSKHITVSGSSVFMAIGVRRDYLRFGLRLDPATAEKHPRLSVQPNEVFEGWAALHVSTEIRHQSEIDAELAGLIKRAAEAGGAVVR